MTKSGEDVYLYYKLNQWLRDALFHYYFIYKYFSVYFSINIHTALFEHRPYKSCAKDDKNIKETVRVFVITN